MARVDLKPEQFINGAAANHEETQNALRRTTREVEGKARGNLSQARASTEWDKIADPDNQTKVGSQMGMGKYGHVDYLVWMEAYKNGAMALEFGHAPSGVFGEKGRLGHIISRAPRGLYILTRAAMLPMKNMLPGGRKKNVRYGRKRGKR